MLEQKIYSFIVENNLIENGDRIVLGVSGGPDSICMLNILNEIRKKNLIKFDIYVAHINHGLRENANIDEKFVNEFCENISVDFFCKKINLKEIAEKEKRGLEETGRTERYKFFEEILKKTSSNKIAIAHNLNDNAETMFLNMFRGCGVSGLIGIKKKNGIYIRPLIETPRFEIEKYLNENKIIARHDESNDENIYSRNKVRNELIPFIEKEFNPNIVNTMNRLSCIAEEEESYFEKVTNNLYNEILIEEKNITNDFEYNKKNCGEIILDLKKFNQIDEILKKRIIFLAIKKIFGTTRCIEKIHIDDILKLCSNNIGNKYLTPNKNTKIVTQKKQLKIMAVNS